MPRAGFEPLSDEARARSLERTLAVAPDGDGIWIFGYGSILWNPVFEHTRSVRAVAAGVRRRLCIWTVHARGSVEHPGLGLGLREEPGDCAGIARFVPGPVTATTLERLWEREMMTGVYRPRWLRARAGTSEIDCLAFVVDRSHPQFAGDLAADEAAAYVARAVGALGSCRDYLEQTVRSLRDLGITDPELDTVLDRVRARDRD